MAILKANSIFRGYYCFFYAFHCNGSPYGSDCRLSRGAPNSGTKWPDRYSYPVAYTFWNQRKGINKKNLGRNPPSQIPPPKGPLTPQILYVWGLFSLQNTGKRPT